MASWTMNGLDKYAAYLQRIQKNTPEIIGAGVYAMAGIVADAVRERIDALPRVPDVEGIQAYRDSRKITLTVQEKIGLKEGFGVSSMQNDRGYLNVKLGFSGYNSVKTRKYPNGQPNALIARSVESGSSYRDKTPFIRPAINACKDEALAVGATTIDEKIYAIEQSNKK